MRRHFSRFDTSICPDPEDCMLSYHGIGGPDVGDTCECCGHTVGPGDFVLTRVRPLRRVTTGWYATQDARFVLMRRDADLAWHVTANEDDDEGLCPPERFATLREAVEELRGNLEYEAGRLNAEAETASMQQE